MCRMAEWVAASRLTWRWQCQSVSPDRAPSSTCQTPFRIRGLAPWALDFNNVIRTLTDWGGWKLVEECYYVFYIYVLLSKLFSIAQWLEYLKIMTLVYIDPVHLEPVHNIHLFMQVFLQFFTFCLCQHLFLLFPLRCCLDEARRGD